jgi:hypothetical protein
MSNTPKPLNNMSHDDVYLLDSNLVIHYLNNFYPAWTAWADNHIKCGKKFFLLPQTIKEISVKNPVLPDGFEPLRLEHKSYEKPQSMLDIIVYEQIVKELNIQGKCRNKLKIDIELIAEAGYYAAAADPALISPGDILQDRVVFASNSFQAVKAIVHTEEKRNIVEKILDDAGFEHLITVRFITGKETYSDFF